MESSFIRLLNISHVDLSFVLSRGNGQAGQSTPPVTLYIMITVAANGTSPRDPKKIPTEDGSPAEDVPKPTMVLDARGSDQSIALEPPLAPPDHLPFQSSTPMPRDQGESSLSGKARIDLDRADEVKKSIDRSNTWEGAVGKIKWVMDTLSPVAEVRVIFGLPILD